MNAIAHDGFNLLCQDFQHFWDEEDIDEAFAILCQSFELFRDKDRSESILRQLQSMVGLDKVKALFLHTKSMVDTLRKQGRNTKTEKLGIEFLGNPGTGKSTIENLHDNLLTVLGADTQGTALTLTLPDYSDDELLIIFAKRIQKFYKNKMKVEGGIVGLHSRIFVRRIGRGRGGKNFRNVWELDDAFRSLRRRQAQRLYQEQLTGKIPDHYLFTKEDMIGSEPVDAINQSVAWKELKSMIGLKEVKESVQALISLVISNYQRELREEKPVQVTLSRLFLGPPGTGKSTVSKLYGTILADLGLLSSGEVITKNASDFIGAYVGQSERNTKKILGAAKGKVLVIDDANMLYPGSRTDVFRVAVIDTLVAEIDNVPGNNTCIIMVGYYDKMEQMLQRSNPGLARRFPLEEAFRFTDFDDGQLSKILDLKLDKQDLGATQKAKQVALEILSRARDRPNFGNGGEVENLLSKAKMAYQKRALETANTPGKTKSIVFEPEDFDANYDRALRADKNCSSLFNDFVGHEDIISQFEGYQQTVAGMRLHGIDPRPYIPFTFVFKGPPGTGKTTTARKVGQIFYDMGFLSRPEVVECSVSDLVAEYEGQTGPKVINLLESALGKVLFIDEAYRLGKGRFASAAVGELVDCMTKERFAQKIVIILAGYAEDMDKLMRINQGLRSRFTTDIHFRSLQPQQCLQLLRRHMGKLGIEIDEAAPDSVMTRQIVKTFAKLTGMKLWASGRDVKALGHRIIAHVFQSRGRDPDATSHLSVSAKDVITFLENKAAELELAEAGM